jgi:DNA repair protein RadC
MVLRCPDDMVEILGYIKNRRRENFGIILLDNAFNLIAKKVMFVGTKTSCTVGVRELLVYALKKDANCVVIFHNHPSGNTEPSKDDIETTNEFYESCKTVGIQLLDHIIVGRYGHSSFMERNLMPKSKTEEKSVANT